MQWQKKNEQRKEKHQKQSIKKPDKQKTIVGASSTKPYKRE